MRKLSLVGVSRVLHCSLAVWHDKIFFDEKRENHNFGGLHCLDDLNQDLMPHFERHQGPVQRKTSSGLDEQYVPIRGQK